MARKIVAKLPEDPDECLAAQGSAHVDSPQAKTAFRKRVFNAKQKEFVLTELELAY